ncbi:MAG: hypothetical protein WB297_12640 [Actinomycetota bacterium]
MSMEKEPSYWGAGWATFAGLMMIMLGIFHAIAGFAEIIDPDAYVIGQQYVLKLNVQTWGWIHLIGGIIIFFAGFAVFRGAVWGRTVGVILAILSAAAAFAWLPYSTFWAMLLIFVDISVIWALTAHGRDVTSM